MKVSVFYFIVGFVIVQALLSYFTPYDDTDDMLNKERSGMALYTDNLTGCQYLKGGLAGGITPRLSADEKHIGCRQ